MEIKKICPVGKVIRWAESLKRDPILRWELGRILNYVEEPDGALAAFDGESIIGAATMKGGMVVGVFVHPDHQRQGVGSALFTAAVKKLREKGYSEIIAEVCDTRALAMIEKLPPEIRRGIVVEDVRRDD